MEDLTLFVPTNNSFKLVVSEEKMFNVSANQDAAQSFSKNFGLYSKFIQLMW
jgi:hypothetical protein